MSITTKSKTDNPWNKRASTFDLEDGGFHTTRPDSFSEEATPTHDEEGRQLILPRLTVRRITVEMPKLEKESNWGLLDHSRNDWPVIIGALVNIRTWLTGTVNVSDFRECENHIDTPTHSEDIVDLWFLHHRGEVAAEACKSFSTLPVKMRIDLEPALESYLRSYESSLESANQTVAYSYLNLWNYAVGKHNTLVPIARTNDVDWINNVEASLLDETFDIQASALSL